MANLFYKSDNHSENYLASIVRIDNLTKHPKADRLQIFNYNGNTLITDMKAQVGDVVIYFPLECAINEEFLKENNLLRDNLLNKDTTQRGFFESKGRVRAQKLVQIPSQGFIIPLVSAEAFSGPLNEYDIAGLLGTDFDMIGDFQLCKKYQVKIVNTPGSGKDKKVNEKMANLLIPGNFKFHNDTAHLGKNIHLINPEDNISITYKKHGSSMILSNPLIKRNLSLVERVAKFFGAKVPETEYGFVYSSGKPKSRLPKGVISSTVKSNKQLYTNKNGDFYKSNIWEQCFNDYKNVLFNGLTVYGEVVGYDATGAFIQKGFDYGCNEKEYKLFVYRINQISADGQVIEYSWDQIKEFCLLKGLTPVQELYNGKAKDLFPELSITEHWNEEFLEKLKEKYLEKDCYMCNNKVPAEGITLRKNGNFQEFEVFKLKAFAFLEYESKQLDLGEVDLESAESTEI